MLILIRIYSLKIRKITSQYIFIILHFIILLLVDFLINRVQILVPGRSDIFY